jgi:SulP family sulfate permease
MLGLIALTMAIIHLLPRVTPSLALAGIVIVSAAIFAGIDAKAIGDMASIEGGLPQFRLPAVPFNRKRSPSSSPTA